MAPEAVATVEAPAAFTRQEFRAFVDAHIIPNAGEFDREERLPPGLIRALSRQGYLGAIVPTRYGGAGLDMLTFGALHEEIGRGCTSVRNLMTVHSMVAFAVGRWAPAALRETWLPRLASGESLGAFALSEPTVGSDAASVRTSASLDGDTYVVNGHKKWMTAGQIADVFLVFVRSERGVSALLVERETPGLRVRALPGLLGSRASMLAELEFVDCRVPRGNLVGPPGFGMATVTSALDIGRYSVASGCVGLAQACLEASMAYASAREQGGALLSEHQLIRSMISDMMTSVRAARLLCEQAGRSKDAREPGTILDTLVAKYFASTTAARTAGDAVQIHGAAGCTQAYPVERFFRDAKTMEIIEGSTQIQQTLIAQHGFEDGGFLHRSPREN